jgi:hypothetical protein
MTFIAWQWNKWIDEALIQGLGEPLLKGLLEAVRSHYQVRLKRSADLLEQYGVESVGDLAQTLAVKILTDGALMPHSRDINLSDEEVSKRINQTITNLLIDMQRKWKNRKGLYESVTHGFNGEPEGKDESTLEFFLCRRLGALQNNPEEQAIVRELVFRFYRHLTPRQKFIFEQHEDFGRGQMTGKEVGQKLKIKKSTLYSEMKKIWEGLAYTLGA